TIAEEGLKAGWLKKGEEFPVPPGVLVKDVEYYSGLLASSGGRTVKEAFVAGTEPAREYSSQWSTITSLPWYQQKAFYIPKEGENMPGRKPEPEAPPAPADPEGAGDAADIAIDPGPQESPAPEAASPPEAAPPPEATPPPA
ncbi:MAG TPA: hypothetical protein VF414_14650, partial [Thermoanaerobaculia bacterium]